MKGDTLSALREYADVPILATLPDPPGNLTPESFAERLYLSLAPVAQLDPTVGWSLLILCNALGQMFQLLDDLVRDTPEGPGWSPLLDLERCPDVALPWLAQFVGTRLLAGSTSDDQRARIASTDGFKRGTAAALRGAAASTLTGSKRVVFRERNGNKATQPIDYAYFLDVITYDSETPNPAATQAALLAQKPGGIVLTYRHTPGQDYQSVRDGYATYTAVHAAYPTYDALRNDTPA